MPIIAESCLKFRQETLAPSGGWLASLAIGLSLSTGIYEYTILSIVFMLSFIIICTASCESAMVLALAYDLIIPFQYQNVGRHLTELEKYWPKFVMGCMIEGLCYLLLHPDLFNLAVIGKTTIMLMIWMSGKKQYPLNLKSDDPAPPRDSSRRSREGGDAGGSSSKDKLPEDYLQFVNSALKKVEGEGKVDDKKRKHIVGMLQRPDKREQAEKSLKSRKIPSYEEWKKSKGQTPAATPAARAAPAAGAAGSPPTFDRMGEEQIKKYNELLKQSGKLDDTTRQKLVERLQKPFADPDWEAARQEIIAAGLQFPEATRFQAALQAEWVASQPPPPKDPNWKPDEAALAELVNKLKKYGSPDAEDVERIISHGPNHPDFDSYINHLRGMSIDTRPWAPHDPFPKGRCGQVWTIPHEVQRKAIPIIRAQYESTKDVNAFKLAEKRLTGTANSLKEIQQRIGRMNEACPGLNLDVHNFVVNDLSAWGGLQADYYEGRRMGREAGGNYEAEYITLHDWLSDPINRKDKNRPNKPRDDKWDRELKNIQTEYTKNKPDRYKDGFKGKAGIPVETILGYREKLDALNNLSEGVKDAILYDVKNAPSAAEGKSIWDRVMAAAQTNAGQTKLIDEFLPKSPELVEEEEADEDRQWRASLSDKSVVVQAD